MVTSYHPVCLEFDIHNSAAAEKSQLLVSSFVINEAITYAEMMWAQDVVMRNYLLNSSSQKNRFFKKMFKDNKIT